MRCPLPDANPCPSAAVPATWIGLLTAGLLSGSLGWGPAAAQSQGGIIGPTPGVICDQVSSTCYDRQGPSVGHTQSYFGSIAANRLMSELRNRPASNAFRLSNGAVCDVGIATCWGDGWQKAQVAQKLTQQLFGSLPSSSPTASNGLQGLQTPKSGVLCDPVGQLCYDQTGLSFGLTREYFGAFAEQTAIRNLAGQAPPRQFQLSNGSACDVMARTCWSDGWSRQRVDGLLSNQLFGGGGSTASSGSQTRIGQCSITRWFKTLFRGSCDVRDSKNSQGRNLEVSLQDGTRYSINRPRGGTYVLTDPQGKTWPLQVRDQGRTISFSWSDRVLTVTPQGASNSGLTLGSFIDSLLGQ
ncbi:hypothetical protein KBZ14_15330 [Synechococcus sp. HJ21-Hayes]|uniref:YcgJ family protein n=1 Tax=unclassified Synechococcus TaxID=2626047 RepID=UPI0020CDAE59|nr:MULTISPECIES: YcgJ family protein [unclassified Synechococcus]MCP9832612.1 hypothetical protein [Synechococcus sp. JJ3a-Johnson]MCP9854231.1 hypothetical protein [Synechococcus sp. HJ21-Hayes]